MLADIADHGAHHEGDGDFRSLRRRDDLAILEDGDAVDQFGDLVEAMGDVENGAPLRLEPSQQVMQVSDLADAERRRRLVENDDRGVGGKRLGDLHDLLLGHREAADDGIDIDMRVDLGQHTDGGAAQAAPVDLAALLRQPAEIDVLSHAEAGDQRKFLKDRGNAGVAGVARIGQSDGFAVPENRTAVGLVDAAEHLDEGRLAGAVGADQAVDLTGIEAQRHTIDRRDAGEALDQADRFPDWRILLHCFAP